MNRDRTNQHISLDECVRSVWLQAISKNADCTISIIRHPHDFSLWVINICSIGLEELTDSIEYPQSSGRVAILDSVPIFSKIVSKLIFDAPVYDCLIFCQEPHFICLIP